MSTKDSKTEQPCTLHSVGNRISLNDLQPNDMFWMKYGFTMVKFRVRLRFNDTGVYAHSVKWCKSSSIIIPYEETETCYYAGRVSKLRGWLML